MFKDLSLNRKLTKVKLDKSEKGIIIHDMNELVSIIIHNLEKMPKGERGIIIHNLTELVGIIIHNIPKEEFLNEFKKDPLNAIKTQGIIIHN